MALLLLLCKFASHTALWLIFCDAAAFCFCQQGLHGRAAAPLFLLYMLWGPELAGCCACASC